VVIDGTEGTGPWYSAFRTIHITNDGWIRGKDLVAGIGQIRIKAQAADTNGTAGALADLRAAVERLEVECDRYVRRAEMLKHDLAALVDEIDGAHAVPVAPEPAIPKPDQLLERLSDLYGLPRNLPRR
jgi:hypothetical protein